jgi:transposase-like protein
MPRTRPPYSPEFRQQMVELVRAGRKPGDLAKEFGCTAQSIANWVAQEQRDSGERKDGLTALSARSLPDYAARTSSCGWNGKSCQKPRPGSPTRLAQHRRNLRVRERESGHLSGTGHVPAAEGLPERLLRVG